MQSLYVEGKSPLHRIPARVKLAVLAFAAIGLFCTGNMALLFSILCISTVLYASLGMPPKEAILRLRPVFLTILFVSLFGFAFNPFDQAAASLLRLTCLMLLAAAITATITIADFMDEIETLARPFERPGLFRAADLGLAVGLVIRFVPEILDRYQAVKEAHAARGLKMRAVAMLAPLIILTLKDADNIAAAIDARGIRRHPE